MKKISVDFSKITGPVKPMHAVCNGPFETIRGMDTREGFKEAGFPYIRNHDASFVASYGGEHTVDVENIFTDMDADENDPASYDFVLTDQYCRICCQEGRKILYRLGSKIEHEIKKYHTFPPKDFGKYARVCEHIIRHLCYGWADGLHLDIPYWEIWCEPDCVNVDGGRPLWQGTEEEFLEFYEVMANHLKPLFPELKFGGPAFTGDHNQRGFQQKFLDYVAAKNLPLDFYSWHGYAITPKRYIDDIDWVVAELDKRGIQTELILDEWNYMKGWVGDIHKESFKTIAGVKGAAFDAASMLACQKTPLAMFMYYDLCPGSTYNGLFSPVFDYQKPFYAFWQFNRLYRLGQEAESSSDDSRLYPVAATGREGCALQLAYYDEEPVEDDVAEISYTGLKGRNEVTFTVTDREYDNEVTRTEILSEGSGRLYVKLNGYSTILLTFRAV